ncbi:hypothetical protein MUK42_22926, partial [Musa troglodytarum]
NRDTWRSHRRATVGPNIAHVKHHVTDDRASKGASFDHRGDGGWVPSSVFEPLLLEPLHFGCTSERAQVGDSIRSPCKPVQSRLIAAVKAVEAPGTETRFSDCFFGPLFQAQHMRFRQRPAPELAFGQEDVTVPANVGNSALMGF